MNKYKVFSTTLFTFFFLSALVAHAQTPPTTGLVGYWNLNDGAGTVAADTAGSNPLTLVGGPTWTSAGEMGGGILLDGVNDVLKCTDVACGGVSAGKLDMGTSDWTIAFWIKSQGTILGSALVAKANSYSGAQWAIFAGYGANTGTVSPSIKDGSCSGVSVTGGARIDDTFWHHVVVTYMRSGNMTRYVDAVSQGNTNISSCPGSIDSTAALTVGGRDITGDEAYTSATFDDVRVYNKALSLSEVQSLYTSTLAPDTTAPTITNVTASNVTSTAATITWSTNENSDTQVEYGTTISYGASSTPNTSLVTAHSVSLTGLSANMLYHFRVKSKDSAGNLSISTDQTFTTPIIDTTAPSVSLTAPTGGATVSGVSVSVSANASDNIGVVGVQFKLDGANLGAEDTTSPYAITWDTTTATNASHTLTAVARDAAGNSTTATGVTVTVSNVVTPPSGVPNGSHPRILLSDTATMSRLVSAAQSNSTEWIRLKSFCDSAIFPDPGAEYYGQESYRFLANFALCYRVAKVILGDSAATTTIYAQKAINILNDGGGAFPLINFTSYSTGSGYGIRNYLPALVLAYDWLYDSPLLTAPMKTDIIARVNGWLDYYAASGYSNTQIVANYNTGYLLGRVLAAIALYGEDPSSINRWNGAITHFNTARQTLDTLMPGGHWPEGWQYGGGVYGGYLFSAAALRSSTGDSSYLSGNWLNNNTPFMLQLLMPNGKLIYDDGSWSAGGPGNVALSGALAAGYTFGWGTTNGKLAKNFLNFAATGGYTFTSQARQKGLDEWLPFLYYDPSAQPDSLVSFPPSAHAVGTGLIAMRSDWTNPNATWASVIAGPYLSFQTEQLADQGHIQLYKAAPLLINVNVPYVLNTARDNTFTFNGRTDTGAIGQDQWHQYCPNPLGNNPIGVNAYIDAGSYVFTSGEFSAAYQIRPIYPATCGTIPATWLNRSTFYLRPDVLVVYDQVQKISTQPNVVPVMDLHLASTTVAQGGSNKMFSLDNGPGRLQVVSVLPATSNTTLVPEAATGANGNKSNWHLTVSYADTSVMYQNFLTVMRAGLSNSSYAFPTVSALTGTNAYGSLISGLLASESATPIAVVFADSGTRTTPTTLQYSYPATTTVQHYVAKLKPSTSYVVTTSNISGVVSISISEGTGATSIASNSAGVISFTENGASLPPSTKFAVNDRVQVFGSTGLNVRASAGTSGTLLGSQPTGAFGTILGGGTIVDGYPWWNVNYDTSFDGWSVEGDATYGLQLVVPDTTAPTVSVTAPAPAATVSGTTVTVSATASDNVGVTGVQFKLDGANLGTEDTTSPYSIVWNTTTATNASHVITAVARDAAGNITTSSGLTVTVNNVVTPPSTKFAVNDRVQVFGSTGLNVRASAGTSGTLLGSQPTGAFGTILGGGTIVDGYPWWNVNYDTSFDGWSVEGDATYGLQLVVPDTTAPSAPGAPSATPVSSSQINLSWGASTDNIAVTGYRVERCQGVGCATFTQVGTPTGTTYSDTSLTPSTSYSYRVRATDAAANLSPYSLTVSVQTQGALPPPPSSNELTIVSVANSAYRLGSSAAYSTLAQSFKNTFSSINGVRVALSRVKSPTATITVSLRSTLAGANLASAVITPTGLSTSYLTPTWVTVNFASPVSVTPGSTYYLVLQSSTNSKTTYYRWSTNKNNLYKDGGLYFGTTLQSAHDALTAVKGN